MPHQGWIPAFAGMASQLMSNDMAVVRAIIRQDPTWILRGILRLRGRLLQ